MCVVLRMTTVSMFLLSDFSKIVCCFCGMNVTGMYVKFGLHACHWNGRDFSEQPSWKEVGMFIVAIE